MSLSQSREITYLRQSRALNFILNFASSARSPPATHRRHIDGTPATHRRHTGDTSTAHIDGTPATRLQTADSKAIKENIGFLND